ncbi:MAG TPA: hypothetical protein VE640_10775 [Candidatus Bathyarchaeia archaeon]|nr:hypothetical protein [Candidatus Bathyarchaeia archaeon]
MLPLQADRFRLIALGSLFLLALGVALELSRPFLSASIGFDSQVAVVHFDRIASGRHVEQIVSTTSKPLLTFIYGPLFALFGDWRPIASVTVLAFAVGVAGVGALVWRIAGPIAAAFSAMAVLAAPTLLFDVGYALATPWAFVGWVAAGLAVTADRPRYGLAGLALLLAALARVETLVVIGVVAAALVVAAVARRPAPRRAWLVPLIGAGAIAVLCLHDWALSGDPLLWTKIAASYSKATTLHVPTPLEVIKLVGVRYVQFGAVTLLAGLGLVRLWMARQYAVALGLVALGPGVAAFLVVLAIRGIFVSERYLAAIDIAVLGAAGIGLAGLTTDAAAWIADRVGGSRWTPGRRQAIGIAVAASIAVVLVWPQGPFDVSLRQQVRASVEVGVDTDRSLPIIAAALRSEGTPAAVAVLVPTAVRPRAVIGLSLPLTSVGSTDRVSIDASGRPLARGQIVLHDRRAELLPDALAILEVSTPTTIGDLRLEPILADSARGLWIVAIR